MSISDLQSATSFQSKLNARPARSDNNRPLQDVCNVRWDRVGSGTPELGPTGEPAPVSSAIKVAVASEEVPDSLGEGNALNANDMHDGVIRTPRMAGRNRQPLADEHDEQHAVASASGSPALVSAMSRLGLDHGKPLTPTPTQLFSFQTPTTARSGASPAFTTPTSTGRRRAAASTPPRTPEERVLAVLADEADPDELATDAASRQRTTGGLEVLDAPDSVAKSWARRLSGSISSDDDSSGDELDEAALERMGISPLSLPGSLCRTPVDDVIDCMLGPADVGGHQEDGGRVAASPVPFRITEPVLGGAT